MNKLSFETAISAKISAICCSLFKSANEDIVGNKLINKFKNCYDYLQILIDIQKEYSIMFNKPHTDRKEILEKLLPNVNVQHNIDVSKSEYGNGYGLIALDNIKHYDEILRVQEVDMITEKDAYNSPFGDFLKTDPLTRAMPNLTLALYVLNEACHSSSKHACYIESQPKDVDTFLYLTSNDIDILQHSQYLHEIVQQFCTICSHYCYLYRIFSQQKHVTTCNFRDRFCFEDFRWAVSIIMSRNNAIPCGNGQSRMLALVPIWDMMNHQLGELTTDFDDETRTLVFYSMKEYNKGDEMCMDYGKRSTLQFFMYSGFVPPANPHDVYPFKIGFNKNDSLYDKKQQVLLKINIDCACTVFNIDYLNSEIIDTSMRKYLAVMLLKCDETLTLFLNSPCPDQEISLYSEQLTTEITSFLSTRIKMNLSCIDRVIEKMRDREIKDTAVNCLSLLTHEKAVLELILTRI